MKTFLGLVSLFLGNQDEKMSCRCSVKKLYDISSRERAKKPIGKGVYQFSIAVVSNYSKLDGNQKSKMSLNRMKQDVDRAAFLSGGTRGESFSLSFPASRGCLHSLAHDPFPQSKNQLTICGQTWVKSMQMTQETWPRKHRMRTNALLKT